MKKILASPGKIAAAVLPAAVLIASCGAAQSDGSTGVSQVTEGSAVKQATKEPSATASSASSPASSSRSSRTAQSRELQLGQRTQIAQTQGNRIYLTITRATVSDTCRYGSPYKKSESDLAGGMYEYLQIWGTFEVENIGGAAVGDSAILTIPEVRFGPGQYMVAADTLDCELGTSKGYESWYRDLKEGEKAKVYGAFVVPKGYETFRIQGRRFTVN